MDLGLKGKCALVTGASKGLGRAMAEELVKEGTHVSICARGVEELEQTAQVLRSHGVKVTASQADVAKADDVQRVIDTTIAALGRIDILVNNAGTAWLDHALNTTDEQWQYCIEINLYSAVRFTRGVAPYMRKQGGGRIINISTVGAHTPPPILIDYDRAKAAMLTFSKATSFELAPDNILVNCVCPALIRTPLWETWPMPWSLRPGRIGRRSYKVSRTKSSRSSGLGGRTRSPDWWLFSRRNARPSLQAVCSTSTVVYRNPFSSWLPGQRNQGVMNGVY